MKFLHFTVPICMPPEGADFTGKVATVSGWGRLKYGGGVPSVLQEVQVSVGEFYSQISYLLIFIFNTFMNLIFMTCYKKKSFWKISISYFFSSSFSFSFFISLLTVVNMYVFIFFLCSGSLLLSKVNNIFVTSKKFFIFI
jgi:hypothetical protein